MDTRLFHYFQINVCIQSSLYNVECHYNPGGLFNSQLAEEIFRFSIDYVNQRKIIGPGIQLEYIVNTTNYIDTFETIQLGNVQYSTIIVFYTLPNSRLMVDCPAH